MSPRLCVRGPVVVLLGRVRSQPAGYAAGLYVRQRAVHRPYVGPMSALDPIGLARDPDWGDQDSAGDGQTAPGQKPSFGPVERNSDMRSHHGIR